MVEEVAEKNRGIQNRMSCTPVTYTPWRIARGDGAEFMVLSGLKQSSKVPVLEEDGDEKIYAMRRGLGGAAGDRVIDTIPSSLNTGVVDPLLIPFLSYAESEILRGWSRGLNRAVILNPRAGVFWLGSLTGPYRPEPFRWFGEEGFQVTLRVNVLGISEVTF